MRPPKTLRNRIIVELHDGDPEHFTFSKLAEMMKISKQYARVIYHREKERQKKE